MKLIEGWYVTNNVYSKQLEPYHVSIIERRNNQRNYFQLSVVNKNMQERVFNFNVIEDAFTFASDVVNKSVNFEDMIQKYEELKASGHLADEFGIRKADEPETTKIKLTEAEVLNAIANHFGKNKSYEVSARKELELQENHQISISFYLIEKYDGIIDETRLTEGDLRTVFNDYLEETDYTFINFKYLGGIRHVGMYVDEDTPYFEGIELEVKEKQKELKKNI